MPRYDTLDCRANVSELDPCLAAEVRLKNQNQYNWKTIAVIILTILLLFAIGAGVACILIFSGSSNEQSPTANVPTTTQAPEPVNVPTTTQAPTTIQVPVTTTVYPSPLSFQPQTIHLTPVVVSAPIEKVPVEQVQSQTTITLQPDQEVFIGNLPRSSRHISSNKVGVINTSGKLFATCEEYKKNGFTTNGVYRLQQLGSYDFLAQCMMDSEDGRAWMVMQKRTNGALNFWNRTFDEYSQGFGDPSTDSWLGLKQIRQMIEVGYKFQLRMEIEGERCTLGQEDLYYVGTWDFSIDSEKEDYRLHVSTFLGGNFTDPLSTIAPGNSYVFNAKRPNTSEKQSSCLERVHMGGWWTVKSGCSFISLNGEYSCARENAMYGLSVFYRRPLGRVRSSFTTSYIRPAATRMMLRVCNGEKDCF